MMDFVCSKDDLVFGVKLASYALGSRSSMPILSGLKMEIGGNRLRLYATDLERAVHCEIPIENRANDEAVVLNGVILAQIAAHLPEDDKISLKTDEADGAVVKLRCGEALFDLPTLPVEDYPEIPALPSEKIAVLKVDSFHRGLDQTVFATLKAGETTRLSLTGVDIVLKSGRVKLVSTNGYRLAMKTIDAEEIFTESEFLIEGSVLTDLDRVLSQVGEGTVDLYQGNGQLFFQSGGVTFIAKTLAEEFPDFDRVVPKDSPLALAFDRRALLATLQRIEITSAEESNAITLRVTTDESAARLNSSSRDKGEAEERVRVKKVPTKDVETSFKAEYMIDALKRMASEEITLWLTDSEKAGLIEPSGEVINPLDAGFLYVCMPVRLTG
jgi:DNA polymerase-3 subunit beta